MGLIRTRQERLKEQAEHDGKDHYRIFYKDGKKKVQVSDFWAEDRHAALAELEIYKKKRALVDPDDSREYFYGTKGGFITDAGNGLEEEHDDMVQWLGFDEKETFLEKAKIAGMRIWQKLRDIRYAVEDFWFFFRHYSMQSNKSHNRSESWSLDSHILDDIEFNVPRIKADKHGVPTEFCERAREKMKGTRVGNVNPSDEEMDVGKKLLDEELDRLLLSVRLYRYYEGYGMIDERDKAYVAIDKEYRKTLPYFPGTDKDLDYAELSRLKQAEWHKIWKWMDEYGQMLWT